jgi:hypothetical protein
VSPKPITEPLTGGVVASAEAMRLPTSEEIEAAWLAAHAAPGSPLGTEKFKRALVRDAVAQGFLSVRGLWSGPLSAEDIDHSPDGFVDQFYCVLMSEPMRQRPNSLAKYPGWRRQEARRIAGSALLNGARFAVEVRQATASVVRHVSAPVAVRTPQARASRCRRGTSSTSGSSGDDSDPSDAGEVARSLRHRRRRS